MSGRADEVLVFLFDLTIVVAVVRKDVRGGEW